MNKLKQIYYILFNKKKYENYLIETYKKEFINYYNKIDNELLNLNNIIKENFTLLSNKDEKFILSKNYSKKSI